MPERLLARHAGARVVATPAPLAALAQALAAAGGVDPPDLDAAMGRAATGFSRAPRYHWALVSAQSLDDLLARIPAPEGVRDIAVAAVPGAGLEGEPRYFAAVLLGVAAE